MAAAPPGQGHQKSELSMWAAGLLRGRLRAPPSSVRFSGKNFCFLSPTNPRMSATCDFQSEPQCSHTLSLFHFSCRACRALGIWRTAAGPPQARESATCDSSFTEKILVMKPESFSGILKERLLHPVLVEPADECDVRLQLNSREKTIAKLRKTCEEVSKRAERQWRHCERHANKFRS